MLRPLIRRTLWPVYRQRRCSQLMSQRRANDAPTYDAETCPVSTTAYRSSAYLQSQGPGSADVPGVSRKRNSCNAEPSLLDAQARNFCAGTWKAHCELYEAGYRVIGAGSGGFCQVNPSRALPVQLSTQLAAKYPRPLAGRVDVDKVTVMGHSMGGMLPRVTR